MPEASPPVECAAPHVGGTVGALPRAMRTSTTARRRFKAVSLLLLLIVPTLSAGAQKRVPLLQKQDLATVGWLLLATAATMPLDRTIAHEFADSARQANGT